MLETWRALLLETWRALLLAAVFSQCIPVSSNSSIDHFVTCTENVLCCHTECIGVVLREMEDLYSLFSVTCSFSEALIKFYFQEIPPPHAYKAEMSMEHRRNEIAGGGGGSPRKPIDQRHRQTRLSSTKIRDQSRRESNPVRLGRSLAGTPQRSRDFSKVRFNKCEETIYIVCGGFAAKPSPLRNCTLRAASNRSGADVLEVECLAGYDGGLPQTFVLEAYESRTMRLRLNVTAGDAPSFRVELQDLLPALTPTLHLVVYAANPKGRSEPAVLEDITLRDAEKRTGEALFPSSALFVSLVYELRQTVPTLLGSRTSCCLAQKRTGEDLFLLPRTIRVYLRTSRSATLKRKLAVLEDFTLRYAEKRTGEPGVFEEIKLHDAEKRTSECSSFLYSLAGCASELNAARLLEGTETTTMLDVLEESMLCDSDKGTGLMLCDTEKMTVKGLFHILHNSFTITVITTHPASSWACSRTSDCAMLRSRGLMLHVAEKKTETVPVLLHLTCSTSDVSFNQECSKRETFRGSIEGRQKRRDKPMGFLQCSDYAAGYGVACTAATGERALVISSDITMIVRTGPPEWPWSSVDSLPASLELIRAVRGVRWDRDLDCELASSFPEPWCPKTPHKQTVISGRGHCRAEALNYHLRTALLPHGTRCRSKWHYSLPPLTISVVLRVDQAPSMKNTPHCPPTSTEFHRWHYTGRHVAFTSYSKYPNFPFGPTRALNPRARDSAQSHGTSCCNNPSLIIGYSELMLSDTKGEEHENNTLNEKGSRGSTWSTAHRLQRESQGSPIMEYRRWEMEDRVRGCDGLLTDAVCVNSYPMFEVTDFPCATHSTGIVQHLPATSPYSPFTGEQHDRKNYAVHRTSFVEISPGCGRLQRNYGAADFAKRTAVIGVQENFIFATYPQVLSIRPRWEETVLVASDQPLTRNKSVKKQQIARLCAVLNEPGGCCGVRKNVRVNSQTDCPPEGEGDKGKYGEMNQEDFRGGNCPRKARDRSPWKTLRKDLCPAEDHPSITAISKTRQNKPNRAEKRGSDKGYSDTPFKCVTARYEQVFELACCVSAVLLVPMGHFIGVR
ncbi:hypothetical protein PR048_019421, partial [Dryococelus australis]